MKGSTEYTTTSSSSQLFEECWEDGTVGEDKERERERKGEGEGEKERERERERE